MRWFNLQRRHLLLCLLVLWISVAAVFNVSAQNAAIPLTSGTAVSGSIDAAALARVYIFSVSAGDTVDLTATGEISLSLLLTDASGTIYGQSADVTGSGTVSLTGITLAQAGAYFVTVFPASGESKDVSGPF